MPSVDLGLLALLADETEDDVVLDDPAGVAEQALVDVADLLDVDVAERDPARSPLDDGGLHGLEHVQHHPVGDLAAAARAGRWRVSHGKRSGSRSEPP